MTATTKPELGECPLTASHTRRACDNGGSCWCIEHPEEVAQINAHPEVIEARSAATAPPEPDWISDRAFAFLLVGALLFWLAVLAGIVWGTSQLA